MCNTILELKFWDPLELYNLEFTVKCKSANKLGLIEL